MLAREALHLLVINLAGLQVDAVLVGIVELAGEIGMGAVGEVPAVRQAHTQYRITRL